MQSLRSTFLPNSLNHPYPYALVFSTNPPVLVCGTMRYFAPTRIFPGSLRHPDCLACAKLTVTVRLDLRQDSLLRPSYRRPGLSNFVIHVVITLITRNRILTVCTSPDTIKIISGLVSTYPQLIDVAEETLGIRHPVFSSGEKLLMSAFSLLTTPQKFTRLFRCHEDAPLPLSDVTSENFHLR